jgi:hypothetical protein
MKYIYLAIVFFPSLIWSQVVINEGSNANGSTIIQPDGNLPDWLELYNTTGFSTDLSGYGLSDDISEPLKWIFPSYNLSANSFLTVIASNKPQSAYVDHYETAVNAGDNWKYFIPVSNLVPNWKAITFSDLSWTSAPLGIGYADGDDATAIANPTSTVYVRKTFNVSDINAISSTILDIDFDDGFVAYLNGVEIARAGLSGIPPNWDEFALGHEASLYSGGLISTFTIDNNVLMSAIQNGTNVLAIEIHNNAANGSDLSLIPYLSFGFNQSTIYYSGTTHPYFLNPGTGGVFETNFSIKSSGETIYLSNPLGVIIDSLVVPDLNPDMSVGKLVDGAANAMLFNVPTPGATNNGSVGFVGFENTPIINLPGGFYTSAMNVSITNTAVSGGQLRYTLDGTNPTSSSTLYTGPLSLNANTVVKARCFSSTFNLLPSEMAVETFFFLEDFTLPVISISTDPVNLYGATGIFDNYNTDWRKPCVIEYFNEDGQKQFESRASVKPDGGAGGSRSNPQHSVTIEPANNLFGEGTAVHFPLIDEKSFIQDYDAFYLRNGSNFWNAYPQKDATLMRIMRESHANSQAYTPVIAFVNGQYFGVYELREKANEGYFEQNYGNDPDSLDLLSVSYFYGPGIIRTVKGSDSSFYNMRNFINSYDPTAPDYFAKSNEKLDLYNFTDYLSAENWFANFDWAYNNMKMARCQTAGNKWRFFLQDMELGIGNGWTDFNANHFDYFQNNNQPNAFWDIYAGLMQNIEFKNYFVNRYADLMNTTFQPGYYTPIVDTMYNQLLPELPRHFQTWTGNIAGGMATYSAIYNELLNQFSNRNAVVRSQIVTEYGLVESVDVTLNVSPAGAGYIKISTIVPDALPWTGVYFDGVPVRITAVANPGYTFMNWQNNTCIPGGDLLNSSILLNIPNDDNFTAVFTGTPEPLSVTISEIHYNPDMTIDGGNWIEFHNYGTTDLDLTNWSVKSKNFWDKYEFVDQTTIPAGGYLVVCQDILSFSSIYPTVTNFVGATGFPWSNSYDSILIYNQHNQVVLNAIYRDKAPFPECADGWGRTLENKYTESMALDSSNWFCGCIGGSPGEAYSPCQEPISFSEVNYNDVVTNYSTGDWAEIRNNTNQAINLSLYTFKDSKDDHIYQLPNVTIQPGGFWVMGNDLERFAVRHELVENVSGIFDFGLANKDVLRLYDDQGILVASALYNSVDTWPVSPSNSDFTLEYNYENGYLDPNVSTSWYAGCEGGSPGRAYTPCPVLPADLNGFLYPNPTNDYINVVFNNSDNSSKNTDLQIVDLNGRLVYKETIYAIEDTVGKELDVNGLRNGMYFIQIIQDGRIVQLPFVKI